MTKFKSNDPDLCIYHGDCPDGFGAAFAVWKRWRYTDFYPATHGLPPPDVRGKHVIIVDFSYSADVLRSMAQQARSITILDHHKSAQASIQPLLDENLIDGLFDMNRSGAVIAWEYFHDTPVPALLLHVQDRDLWRWQMANSREILAYLDSFKFSFDGWSVHAHKCASEAGRKEMVMLGEAIDRAERTKMQSLLNLTQRTMVIGGISVPVANMPFVWASDACNIMAQAAPFAASYFDRPDGRIFSLRSRADGVDVSEIAKEYGGGGHAHAAGFRMSLGWGGDRAEDN